MKPRQGMSDAQCAAVLLELQRVTLVGAMPDFMDAKHVEARPELVPTDSERIAYEVQQRRAARAPARAQRVRRMNARRDMRPSAS